MIKFENTEALGWEHAIRGMRNPMNSWERIDSTVCPGHNCDTCDLWRLDRSVCSGNHIEGELVVGPNDHDLMMRLAKGGPVHAKYRRMITVYVDITAPLYWWKEFDTYKVGTVANSCSTMHKIAAKEFTLEDFSCEHLISNDKTIWSGEIGNSMECLDIVISTLNYYREYYLSMNEQKVPGANERAKELWWQMIQLLPSSYNQKRTVMLNYEVLANIYKSRRNHKLDEWAEMKLTGDYPADMYPNKFINGFCDWIKTLPYSELITGEENTHA